MISKKYLPPILWAIIIFILSSMPGDDYPAAVFNYAYIAHFIEFFILTILVLRAIGIKDKHIYLTLIICGLYALSDEIHQIFVINRSFSFLDWLVDFLAILTGIKFWLYRLSSKLTTKYPTPNGPSYDKTSGI